MIIEKNLPSVTIILAEEGLCVQDYGCPDITGEAQTPRRTMRKFINAFREVWRQIPERDRATLLEFWRAGETERVSPRIVLGGLQLAPLFRNKAACVNGRELYFNVLWLDDWNRKDLSHVIAHELGHAICYPHGWYGQHVCTAYRDNECVPCECRAYSYMASWGFDPFHGMLPKPKKKLAERFRSSG